jgi:hypothetical protein
MRARWSFDRYAFGAARIALHAEPYPGRDRALALWHGLAIASREWERGGRSLRTLGLGTGALLLAAWLSLELAAGALRTKDASRDLEIVMFEAPAPEPPLLEPVQEPEPAPEPEPVVEPEPAPEPAAPVRVAALPPPAPAPIAKPAPTPVAKPTPPRPVRARPELPATPPRIAAAPPPAATPRAPAPRPALPRRAIAIDSVAAPAAPASVRPPADPAPRQAPRKAPQRAARPVPSFDLGAPAAPSLLAEAAPPGGRAAQAPAAASARARAPARSTPRPPAALALPALAAGAPVRDPGAEPTPARVDRQANAQAARSAPARSTEPRLSGVPLGSLASCVSDREEDALKQQLVAIVERPTECVSPAGRYRFVETRNLNSFLLWVERAPTRREADRCVELTFALECVRKRAGGEWSRG